MAAAESSSEGRKGDGVVIVVQDNALRQLTIFQVNEVAASQLGYDAADLNGRKLEVLLGARTAAIIDEDLEYEDDAPDMGEVLARQRELRLRTHAGEEFAIPTTINRMMAEDKNARFQIVIPNEREGRAKSQLKHFLKTSLDGHMQIDEATGLPNRATAEAYLRLMNHYMAEAKTEAAFVVLRLDRFQKSVDRYGEGATSQLLQHVANCCRGTFRSEDVICALGGPMLGLLLVDISRESVRVVLNRLRWNIRAHTILFGGKPDFSTTVSIGFEMLTPENGDGLLERVEAWVADVETEARNVLLDRAG